MADNKNLIEIFRFLGGWLDLLMKLWFNFKILYIVVVVNILFSQYIIVIRFNTYCINVCTLLHIICEHLHDLYTLNRESRYIKLEAVWKFDKYNIQSCLDISVLKAKSWNVAWKEKRLRLAFPCSTGWLNNF